jgi:type VI secretion system secreted protein VgrG
MTFATACSINRYYDPATGQFVSVDPLVNETDQAYVYAGDDPINYTDSTGLWFGIDDLIATVVGAVVGGTTSVVEQVVEGHGINWTKVSISASAGAAGGEATIYCGPFCGGAVAGSLNTAGNELYIGPN